jgi:hypothetical protein
MLLSLIHLKISKSLDATHPIEVEFTMKRLTIIIGLVLVVYCAFMAGRLFVSVRPGWGQLSVAN